MTMNEKYLSCKEVIEAAVSANYADSRLDTKAAVAQVVERFGADRVAYILAITVKAKDHDGRISSASKAWAQTVPTTDDHGNCYLIVDKCNPGLTDLFVKQFRTEYPERKPSVLEKLTSPPTLVAPHDVHADRRAHDARHEDIEDLLRGRRCGAVAQCAYEYE